MQPEKMKTRLIIWEPLVVDEEEIFYFSEELEGFPLPQIGDIITVKRAHPKERGRPHREKDYPVRVKFRVTGREYVIHERQRCSHQSMVCELTVERA